MEQLYIILSFMTLLGAMMVITSLNPIHSVFWLVLVFLNTSGLLLLIGFNFMPLMLIMVYVGAMAMLFLFVIMMLDILQLSSVETMSNMIPIVLCVFTNLLTHVFLYFKDSDFLVHVTNSSGMYLDHDSQINSMAKVLYSLYAYPFIIISLLLLVAMVGAIVLVLDLGIMTSSQLLTDQHQSLVNE